MGKDMAAGNTPQDISDNSDKSEIILDASKFNFNFFDDDECIKLEVFMWMYSNKFMTHSIKECINPCKYA